VVIDDVTLPWARRIDKLLRQAEGSDSQPFAERCYAKAEELMVTKGVTELMLAEFRGLGAPEEIVEEHIDYTGIYRQVVIDIAYAITRSNDCYGLQSHMNWARPPFMRFYVIGFKSDVAHVKLLDTSIQIQCARALRAWWKVENSGGWYSGMAGYKARRQFIVGYAAGLRVKLKEAKLKGVAEGAKAAGKEVGISNEEAVDRTALVLRSRKGQVKDWVDARYGSSLRSVSRRYDSGGMSAHRAGREAGMQADVGQPGLGKNKAIGGR
jgi:hypothetical protein